MVHHVNLRETGRKADCSNRAHDPAGEASEDDSRAHPRAAEEEPGKDQDLADPGRGGAQGLKHAGRALLVDGEDDEGRADLEGRDRNHQAENQKEG